MIEANNLVIDDFKSYLINKGLAKKTISHHINNIDMFANHYLTTYDYCGTIFDGYKNLMFSLVIGLSLNVYSQVKIL